jgi:hypothetical protein
LNGGMNGNGMGHKNQGRIGFGSMLFLPKKK